MFKISFNTFFVDKVISVNGVTTKSVVLDLAIKLKKKLALIWIGTDVSIAKEAHNNNRLISKYIDYAESFTEAPWFIDELMDIGIKSKLVGYLSVSHEPNYKDKFDSIGVLSYISEGREDFYGLPQIIDLAKQNPRIPFHIVGTKGGNQLNIDNIYYYGWVDKVKYLSLLNKNALFIRLTKHDGFSLAVREALANGNYVIWTQEYGDVFKTDEMDLFKTFNQVKDIVISKN